jgi:hypothetical protein
MEQKKWIVSVDSMIDIITNSSTEIYTFPSQGAEQQIEKVINKILETAGSPLKFKDLFNIRRIPSAQAMNDFHEWLKYECPEKMGADNVINPIDPSEWEKDNKPEYDRLFEEYLDSYDKYCYSKGMAEELELTTKDGADAGVVGLLENIFESKEVEN